MSKVPWRLVGLIILAALAIILVFWGPAACNTIRGLRTQNAVTQGQGAAFRNSAVDARDAIGNVTTNETGRADQARQDTEEITNAKGAADRVPPDVRAAGLRAHCRRASAQRDPACVALRQ